MLGVIPPSEVAADTASANIAEQFNVARAAVAVPETPKSPPPLTSYESLKAVSRELAKSLVSSDSVEAEKMLSTFEHQPFERHADGIATISLRDLAKLRDQSFYERLVRATDKMGERGAPRALLKMALSSDLPRDWRNLAARTLIGRVNRPELVGQSPLIEAFIELAKSTDDPKIAFDAGRALGSSKVRGFESLTLMSFYLNRTWEIQPEAHRGMVCAVGDMYEALTPRDRETARGILSGLRSQLDPNTAEICRTCRHMGLGMWVSAPFDFIARTVKRCV